MIYHRGFIQMYFFSSPAVNVSSPNLPKTALKLEVPAEVHQQIRSNVWILRWGKLETLVNWDCWGLSNRFEGWDLLINFNGQKYHCCLLVFVFSGYLLFGMPP